MSVYALLPVPFEKMGA